MKKAYLFLVTAFVIFSGAILFTREKEYDLGALKERFSGAAPEGEWMNAKASIQSLQDQIRKNPDDAEAKNTLATAYMQEARISGNYDYYNDIALKLVKDVLKKNPGNFNALYLKSTLLLSNHHFSEALETGKKGVELNPYHAGIFGVLCDAYVELGDYDKAVLMADSMNAIRPDIRSYSRIAYLREIFGNYESAKEAMEMAVQSGLPGMEQTEWCRVQLGHLYEATGDTQSALLHYNTSLQFRPDYPFALAGLGRIAKTRRDYKEAIQHFEKASTLITEYSFHEELFNLYTLLNEKEKAGSAFNTAITILKTHSHGKKIKGEADLHTDKELAWLYMKSGDNKKALEHAWNEYNRRPRNIDVNETAAWAYYLNGEYKFALLHIREALRTNSNKAELLYRASEIFKSNGYPKLGEKYSAMAKEMNPYFHVL
jgi:tetratricopeptide (TPR) repeat protein